MKLRVAPAITSSLFAFLALTAPAWARPDGEGDGELWHYAATDKVESVPSLGGHFRIHFTRQGVDAVPEMDADNNGVPDHVEDLAELYEKVLAFYVSLGFQQPLSDGPQTGNNGGDDRFDVYLLDFAGKADGNFVRELCEGDTCAGYMVQENDFAGYGYPSVSYANRILSSHELFHAVQASYDANQNSVISEGTAVWATEKFDQALSDFEQFLPGFLQHTDRSLDKPMLGPVDGFSYGAAIFFEFLDEHVSKNVVRELWQDCVNGTHGVKNPQWLPALVALLPREHSVTFGDEFAAFAQWNLRTGKYADPKVSYLHGKGYPLATVTVGDEAYRDDELRVFYASTQYVRVPVAGPLMTAAVVSKQDLAPLRLALLARKGNVLGAPLWIPLQGTGPVPMLDVSQADEVWAAVVNTAQNGDSIKGSLCIGTPVEVADCLPKTPAPVVEATADAGSTEVAADSALAQADAPANPAKASGQNSPASGGCSLARSAGDARGLALLALALLTLAPRRREVA